MKLCRDVLLVWLSRIIEQSDHYQHNNFYFRTWKLFVPAWLWNVYTNNSCQTYTPMVQSPNSSRLFSVLYLMLLQISNYCYKILCIICWNSKSGIQSLLTVGVIVSCHKSKMKPAVSDWMTFCFMISLLYLIIIKMYINRKTSNSSSWCDLCDADITKQNHSRWC